jgi:hypothetical protein
MQHKKFYLFATLLKPYGIERLTIGSLEPTFLDPWQVFLSLKFAENLSFGGKTINLPFF